MLMFGKTWYLHQRFGDQMIFATDKCLEAQVPLSAARPDLSFHLPVSSLDEKKNRHETVYDLYVIGLQSKFYIRHKNTDLLASDFVLTDSYIVTEICDMNTGRCKYILKSS
nr:unnamed protein product [Callosobruchus analis]